MFSYSPLILRGPAFFYERWRRMTIKRERRLDCDFPFGLVGPIVGYSTHSVFRRLTRQQKDEFFVNPRLLGGITSPSASAVWRPYAIWEPLLSQKVTDCCQDWVFHPHQQFAWLDEGKLWSDADFMRGIMRDGWLSLLLKISHAFPWIGRNSRVAMPTQFSRSGQITSFIGYEDARVDTLFVPRVLRLSRARLLGSIIRLYHEFNPSLTTAEFHQPWVWTQTILSFPLRNTRLEAMTCYLNQPFGPTPARTQNEVSIRQILHW